LRTKKYVVQNKNGKKFDGSFSGDVNSNQNTEKKHFLSIEQSKT
jgi:hypothetical protein